MRNVVGRTACALQPGRRQSTAKEPEELVEAGAVEEPVETRVSRIVDDALERAEPGKWPHTSQPPPTVLIVDDDPGIREMLVDVLTLEGYPTETAKDGGEALERLSHGGPRVVLLDLLMPNVDGAEVVHALEQQPSERGRHHIILVSALINFELERYRNLRVDGRVPKPFTVDQLLSVIESVEVH